MPRRNGRPCVNNASPPPSLLPFYPSPSHLVIDAGPPTYGTMRTFYLTNQICLFSYGRTVLHHTASQGRSTLIRNSLWPLLLGKSSQKQYYIEAARLMLRHPRIDPNVVNRNGWTALLTASKLCRPAAVEVLLKHPATDAGVATPKGNTAFHLACEQSCLEVVSLLLQSAPHLSNRANTAGLTPLMVAVWAESPDIVSLLLMQGDLDVNARMASDGSTALSSAVMKLSGGQARNKTALEAIVMMLLTDPRTNVNTRRANGDSPMHAAVFHGDMRAAAMLLKRLDINLGARNERGQTAADYAEARGHSHLLDVVLPAPRRPLPKRNAK